MLTKGNPQKIVPIGDAVLSIEDWAKYLGIKTDTILQWEEEFGCNGMAIKIAECWQSKMPSMPLEQAIESLRRSQEHIKHLHLKESKDDVQAFDVVIAAAKSHKKYIKGVAARNLLNDFSFDIMAHTKSMHPATLAALVQQLQNTLKDYGVVIDKEVSYE